MGNCLGKQQKSLSKCETDSKFAPENKRAIVNSSSSPGCLSEEYDSNNQNINIDQIALNFVSNTSTVRHSYPNTPKNSSNNLVASHSSPASGLLNNSVVPVNAPSVDDEQLTLRSFSNSSTPRIDNAHVKSKCNVHRTPSSRHSVTEYNSDHSLKKFARPLSIAENSSNGCTNGQTAGFNSTYLTSVTGPEVQKAMLYQISDADFWIALFDYNARDEEEISLRKGDQLRLLDESDEDWLFVENMVSNKKGYVPFMYAARKGSVEAADWFFYSISRKDAERLLLLRGNIEGTFLIRCSETQSDQFSLSVHNRGAVNHYRVRRSKRSAAAGNCGMTNCGNNNSSSNNNNTAALAATPNSVCGVGGCNNTMITPSATVSSAGTTTNCFSADTTEMFYITSRFMFPSLHDLVSYYSADANGLCCALTRPCPRPPPVTSDLTRRTRDRWEIPRSSIELIIKLGSGNFGDVFQGKWNGTTDVAVKTLKPGTMAKDEFLKEARIMKKLNHPNLVRLYAVCSDDPIYIVTELMSKGSLLEYLRSDEGREVTQPVQLDMMGQIANGMSYLEKEGYIHRDLAARNILIGDDYVCKIADFGLTRIVHGSGDIYNAKQGAKFPIKWTAPEAALLGKFTVKSDVWSYGIVLYEIITHGQTPFPAMNNTQTLQQVERGYRMQQPHQCPNEIYAIMLSCWESVAENRPDFRTLADFFNDYTDDCKYRPSTKSPTAPVIAAAATVTGTKSSPIVVANTSGRC